MLPKEIDVGAYCGKVRVKRKIGMDVGLTS